MQPYTVSRHGSTTDSANKSSCCIAFWSRFQLSLVAHTPAVHVHDKLLQLLHQQKHSPSGNKLMLHYGAKGLIKADGFPSLPGSRAKSVKATTRAQSAKASRG